MEQISFLPTVTLGMMAWIILDYYCTGFTNRRGPGARRANPGSRSAGQCICLVCLVEESCFGVRGFFFPLHHCFRLRLGCSPAPWLAFTSFFLLSFLSLTFLSFPFLSFPWVLCTLAFPSVPFLCILDAAMLARCSEFLGSYHHLVLILS